MGGMGRWGAAAIALVLSAGCRDADADRIQPIEDVAPLPPDAPAEVLTSNPQKPPPDPLDPTPTRGVDGIPAPIPNVYTDKGAADPGAGIRGLISFPIRDYDALHQSIREIYDPASPRFRRYMTAEEWTDLHAPPEEHVAQVADWLRQRGFEVPRVASNRLLLQFTGNVAQFNDAFGVELRVFSRKSPQGGNDPHDVYGLLTSLQVPRFVRERIHAVVALDLAADTRAMPGEGGTVGPPPAEIEAFTPQQIAAAYNFDELHRRGFRGRGVRLGVTIGAGFRYKDVRGLWRAFGIERADPIVIQTMEPPATRYREGTLDVQWSGAMAPEAELVVYMGPDARNTSMIYTFNEAIAQNRVDVITDSFAHREDSEPRAVHEQYGQSAAMAAALGITVVAASGDSAGVDTPSSSPYVTAVGGTELFMDGLEVVREVTWDASGSGLSRTFETPWWQEGLPGLDGKRAVADVALNSGQNYHFVFLGNWWGNYGTSFAAPVFAAMVATVDSARLAAGRPRVGWLNAHLYTRPEVQAGFRDITEGGSWHFPSGPGWDIPTGWGAPDAARLADTLP